MNEIRFHAKHIILEKNPGVILYQVNRKLEDFGKLEEKFTFIKLVRYYSSQVIAEHEQSIHNIRINIDKPEMVSSDDARIRLELNMKEQILAIEQYQKVIIWCKEEFNFLHKELEILSRLDKDYRTEIGAEYIQLPDNPDIANVKKVNGLSVPNYRRETTLIFGMLRKFKIILQYDNTSLGKFAYWLTGYAESSIRKGLSYFEKSAVPPEASLDKEKEAWEKVRDQFKEMLVHMEERIEYIQFMIKKKQEEEDEKKKRLKDQDPNLPDYI